MGGLSSAVLWWEEWQLRILVLSSLFIQWLLFFTAGLRKRAIPSWFRSIIWLAYLGSDALAIYALANLFSRQRRQDCSSGHGYSILEVLWAPVLLIHLGGQDNITSYNIEDNELWMRHVVTSVSQVTVSIYVVFCKTWSGGDKRLLLAAILFFIPGILKCIQKPLALKNASINSLVSSDPALRMNAPEEEEINSVEDYVQKIRAFIQADNCRQAQGEDSVGDVEADHQPRAQGDAASVNLQSHHHSQTPSTKRCCLNKQREKREASRLFVDLSSPYAERLGMLKSFWVFDEKQVYDSVQTRLFYMFELLYTKRKMPGLWRYNSMKDDRDSFLDILSACIRFAAVTLPTVAIVLSNRQANTYNGIDLKVTNILFAGTAMLEYYGLLPALLFLLNSPGDSEFLMFVKLSIRNVIQYLWSKQPRATSNSVLRPSLVGQYALVGLFVRSRRHTKTTCILSLFNCKDFVYQLWSMKACSSSFAITELVLKYVKKGWEGPITDVDRYWKFNDRRGQCTVQSNLSCSLRIPFDESVLLWHIATDFCFYYMGASEDHQCGTAQHIRDASVQDRGCAAWCERSAHHGRAVQCREMSNYMIYLLFVKPEMLLPGTRRNLLMDANTELEEILKDDKPLLKKILKGDKPSLIEFLKGKGPSPEEIERGFMQTNKPFLEFLKGKGPSSEEIERGIMQSIIAKLQHRERREEDPGYTEPPTEAEQFPSAEEGFVHDAWKISKVLLALGDEKMWEVIEGVWVEMLCFSASRCRGYLHAKSMGTGVELLTYVWFLLSRMGMETLPERLQRTELSRGGVNASAAPSTS